MKKYLIVLFSIFPLINISSQINVKIILHTIPLEDSVKVFIAGSKAQLGNWDPGAVEMQKVNKTTWSRSFSFKENESIEFKFTLGQWSMEGFEKENQRQSNYSFTAVNDTALEYTIKYWGSNSTFKGQITGKLDHYKQFKGKGIHPRDVVVWLPPDYESDSTKRFPVIYAHDGQNLFNPATSSTGVDWQIDETADSLIRSGKIRSMIVVGIYNTISRTKEYSNSDSGYAYMNFIVDELKPFIDSTYRTLTDRENTATLGSSMGGMISFMLLWEHTDVFSKAALFSPVFKVWIFDYLPFIENYAGPKKNIKFYIDNGGVGLEQQLQPGIDEAVVLLGKKGYLQGTDFIVFYDKAAEHNEEAWAKRVWRPLMFLFGKEKGD